MFKAFLISLCFALSVGNVFAAEKPQRIILSQTKADIDPVQEATDKAMRGAIEHAMSSVYTVGVFIAFKNDDGIHPLPGPVGTGSGFSITDDGLVMTAAHVVYPHLPSAPLVQVGPQEWNMPFTVLTKYQMKNSGGETFEGRLVAVDTERDLAILAIVQKDGEHKKFPYISFATDNIERGDGVITIGSPFGTAMSPNNGIVTNPSVTPKAGEEDAKEYIQTNALIQHGNSGGPLIRLRDHKVVGVVDAALSPDGTIAVGIGLAIPSKIASAFADETFEKYRKATVVNVPKK